ncbi:MAG: 30S ribosomal protein S6 [Patescibacteria group bacterium]
MDRQERGQNMQNYELLVIVSSKISEEEIPFVRDKVFELIKKNEGTIVRDNNLGKKKLAYPIKNQRYGFYVQVDFDLPGANLRKIEKELAIMDEVTRHIVTVRDVLAIARAEKRAKEAKERRIEKPVAEVKPIFAAEVPVADKVEAPAVPRPSFADPKPLAEEKAEKPVKKEQKKVSLEELDEKLDHILDDDILGT